MVVFDSYAWIEFFDGSEKGKVVGRYVNGEDEIFTPTVCLAEIKVKLLRENVAAEDVSKTMAVICGRSALVSLNRDISLLSAENKVKYGLYLIDAIVYSTAQHLNAELVSGDKHFENLRGVLFLR